MTNTITTGTGAGDVVNGNDSSSKVYKQVTISTPATSTTNTESIFRTLSAHYLSKFMKGNVVIDFRNALNPENFINKNTTLHQVGRGPFN